MYPPNKEQAALAGGAHSNKSHRQSYKNRCYQQANCRAIKDFVHLNRVALNQLPQLLKALGVSFREERHETVMLNPRRPDTHYGSFRINRRTGRWSDFALQEACGGDAVSLVAYLRQVRQGEAAQWIQGMLGVCHD